MNDAAPTTTPDVAPVAPEQAPPVTAPEVAPEQAPAKPPRTVEDVIKACDEFTALEWLNVVRGLDMPSHAVQSDVVIAALAVAVVEDARETALWRWDKFKPLSLPKLLDHLEVNTDEVGEADKSGAGA